MHDIQYFDDLCRSWQTLCEQLAFSEQRLALIHLLARLHIELTEQLCLERGPKPGSVPKNDNIWNDLLITLDEKKSLNITPNLSQIARKHNVKRQTVDKKWKILQQKSKVDRNV